VQQRHSRLQQHRDLRAALPGSEARYSQLQIFINDTVASNVAVVLPYRPAGSPSVLSVSGCASADADSCGVTGCAAGDVVTITGSNIAADASVQVYNPAMSELYSCARPVLLSSTALSCVLPYVVAASDAATLAVRITSLQQQSSNCLLGLTYGTPTAGGADSSSYGYYTRWVVSVTVLVPVVAALLVLNMLQLRRQRSGKRSNSEMSRLDVTSSSLVAVENEM
jgi:hypothetical protein